MTEDNSSQKTKKKPRISVWTLGVLGIGVLGIVMFPMGFVRQCGGSIDYRLLPETIILSCLAIAGYIIAAIQIKENPGQFRGKRLATIGMWMAVSPCLLLIIVGIFSWLFPKPGERIYQCRNNLGYITAANLAYADENAVDGNRRILRKNEWKILVGQLGIPPWAFICQGCPTEPFEQWQHRISEISCYVELQAFPVSATGAKVPVYACTQHVSENGKGFFPIAWSDGSTTFFRGTLAEFRAKYQNPPQSATQSRPQGHSKNIGKYGPILCCRHS